mmetsp:Transcript_64381/g.153564  ORF Transcript_64381/g.153564 Transcript_64381/m.153564 type:complete len:286 (-) Transcript_64381:1350-2207(-)
MPTRGLSPERPTPRGATPRHMSAQLCLMVCSPGGIHFLCFQRGQLNWRNAPHRPNGWNPAVSCYSPQPPSGPSTRTPHPEAGPSLNYRGKPLSDPPPLRWRDTVSRRRGTRRVPPTRRGSGGGGKWCHATVRPRSASEAHLALRQRREVGRDLREGAGGRGRGLEGGVLVGRARKRPRGAHRPVRGWVDWRGGAEVVAGAREVGTRGGDVDVGVGHGGGEVVLRRRGGGHVGGGRREVEIDMARGRVVGEVRGEPAGRGDGPVRVREAEGLLAVVLRRGGGRAGH